MKRFFSIFCLAFVSMFSATVAIENDLFDTINSRNDDFSFEELDYILHKEGFVYVYLPDQVIESIVTIYNSMNIISPAITQLYDSILNGSRLCLYEYAKNALADAHKFIIKNNKAFYNTTLFQESTTNLMEFEKNLLAHDPSIKMHYCTKKNCSDNKVFCNVLVKRKLRTADLNVYKDAHLYNDLLIEGDLYIDGEIKGSVIDEIESKLNLLESCCEALQSEIDTISISLPDEIISQIDLLESCCETHDSRLDLVESCCESLNSQIDNLTSNFEYAYIYSTQASSITPSNSIPFDQNGEITSGITHSTVSNTDQIIINVDGVYRIDYTVTSTGSMFFAVSVNGIVQTASQYGANTGGSILKGVVILSIAAPTTIQLTNYSAATTTTLSNLNGVNPRISSSIIIQQLSK